MLPAGTGKGSPTSGRLRAGSPISRETKATAGWLASSCKAVVRSALMRATPGVLASAATSSGVKNTVSPAPLVVDGGAVRTYKSAGRTVSSHWVTDSRKLATITVNATARLKDATTPLTETAAVSRTRRARSTASNGNKRCATSGATRSNSRATSGGRAVMPPTSSSATET